MPAFYSLVSLLILLLTVMANTAVLFCYMGELCTCTPSWICCFYWELLAPCLVPGSFLMKYNMYAFLFCFFKVILVVLSFVLMCFVKVHCNQNNRICVELFSFLNMWKCLCTSLNSSQVIHPGHRQPEQMRDHAHLFRKYIYSSFVCCRLCIRLLKSVLKGKLPVGLLVK